MGAVTLNVKVDAYSNRVLDMVKAAYGLSNKSEAVNKLVHEYGKEMLEPELKAGFADAVLKRNKEWEESGGFKRKMTLKELEAL
ncbi:hypothetical protein AUJ16_01675 [Candidatus Micrarchaeota archaeon CG1_02_60_51]|nr:MAG: hypothetical protein AUJ16_01675 [Candidatus Micrarchaeota archaeon CG1_02_60_51]PIO01886.1 MAG: hypothetical protein COT58_02815 [Candidatus Micrarchaeota archaeon CG09_land_8_20_14_0_10_60_16]PIY91488.1 MAG: hypothetical protein COY71_02880 [Candidatus Micrarchaeota archaeon CG_4_10_14_0_8_um_filter_60_7]